MKTKNNLKQNPLLCLVAAARPNFMKIAALIPELEKRQIHYHLIHTGQHYDHNMSDVFFQELGLPEPDVHLNAGSGTHAQQTAEVMVAFEKYCLEFKPKQVVLVGDVNSTLACSIVASKLGIFITHVEAGLRSFDWSMPEEVNRVVTDRLSNLFLIHSPEARENLIREGCDPERIVDTGNVMIDIQKKLLPKAKEAKILDELNLKKNEFFLCTLHRPANVDTEQNLKHFCSIFLELAQNLPLVLPVHPRTKKNLENYGLLGKLTDNPNIILTPPIGYVDCLALASNAKIVLTDSGGLQEETTGLGTPCLTLRENTERPVTVTEGTNQLVGSDFNLIMMAVKKILNNDLKNPKCPKLWDGRAGERCVEAILKFS